MVLPAEALGLDGSDFEDIKELGKQLGVTLKSGDLKMTLRTGMNEQNKQTANFELSMGNLILITATADGSYTPTGKTPETGLPAGAKSIGFEQWIMSIS